MNENLEPSCISRGPDSTWRTGDSSVLSPNRCGSEAAPPSGSQVCTVWTERAGNGFHSRGRIVTETHRLHEYMSNDVKGM